MTVDRVAEANPSSASARFPVSVRFESPLVLESHFFGVAFSHKKPRKAHKIPVPSAPDLVAPPLAPKPVNHFDEEKTICHPPPGVPPGLRRGMSLAISFDPGYTFGKEFKKIKQFHNLRETWFVLLV